LLVIPAKAGIHLALKLSSKIKMDPGLTSPSAVENRRDDDFNVLRNHSFRREHQSAE